MDLFALLEQIAPDLPTVQIEPCTGEGPHGEIFGPPAPARGFLVDKRHGVVDSTGAQVTASAVLCLPLTTVCPVRSRITLPDGRTTRAVAVARHDGHGLPTPDHLEVSLT